MRTTIVTTTINVPTFLTGYADNIRHYGNSEVDFVIVGDKKSPSETRAFCDTIPNCIYLDVPRQQDYLRQARCHELSAHLPFNSVTRLNIGTMYAYDSGADIVILIDDDNFATKQDAVFAHQIVGAHCILLTYRSSSGWLNTCSFLKEAHNTPFYPRGYAQEQRWHDGIITTRYESRTVAVNAGFWLNEPDIDAVTRLERKLTITGAKIGFPGTIALAPGTWSPFNSQNTAFMREVIPAYFLSPHVGRHADILASYVVARLAEHFGHVITFGNPFARHDRQAHDLWNDLDIERAGIRMTDGFCKTLREIKITAHTYHQGFGQIAAALRPWADTPAKEAYVEGMHIWHQCFEWNAQ